MSCWTRCTPGQRTPAWAVRSKAGVDALVASAIKGKGAMPPKGGLATATDADIRAAVEYMLVVVAGESRERKPVIIERSDLVEHAFDGLDAIGIHQGARCDGRDEANYPTSSKRHDATKPDKPARLAVFRRRIVKR